MTNRQLALGLGFRPALTREDFLIAQPNAEAIAWLDRWPDWPNLELAIVGPAGSGKTHLSYIWQLHATAALLNANALHEIPVDVLATGNLILEDFDRTSWSEESLFHLLNLMRERGHSLLVTARSAPARWHVTLPDLASRLKALPIVSVSTPDDNLLIAVMVKLFADRHLTVGEDVIDYLSMRIERSFSAVYKIVAALDEVALERQRKITIPLAREVLQFSDK